MITAFLIGFAIPTVLFLVGLAILALWKSRQEYSIREARQYHRAKVR